MPGALMRARGQPEARMKDAKTYRQYAADCRRMAQTMSRKKDRETLLNMANVWEERAADAERNEKKRDR
jgi:hypothetical protein